VELRKTLVRVEASSVCQNSPSRQLFVASTQCVDVEMRIDLDSFVLENDMPQSAVQIEVDHSNWSNAPDTEHGQAITNPTSPKVNEHGTKPVHMRADDVDRTIDAGTYSVIDLKMKFGIPADYAMEQVKDGKFCPIEDTASVTIHGGEVFISHVRRGGSS